MSLVAPGLKDVDHLKCWVYGVSRVDVYVFSIQRLAEVASALMTLNDIVWENPPVIMIGMTKARTRISVLA